MIRIAIPAIPPRILTTRGIDLFNSNCAAYHANPVSYDNGSLKFKFTKPHDIFGSKSVKNILSKAQHQKCCYCESKPLGTSFGEVEHFRPKGDRKSVV